MDLIQGENVIVETTLLQSDGTTALNLTSLSSLTAKIIQGGKTKAVYVFGIDAEIRQGDAANIVAVEITKTLSNILDKAETTLALVMEKADAAFEVDEEQCDISQEVIFTVI